MFFRSGFPAKLISYANAREVLRLDALLKERDAAIGKQTAHIHHLESLVAERERIIGDMDRRLLELNAALVEQRAQRHLSSEADFIGQPCSQRLLSLARF